MHDERHDARGQRDTPTAAAGVPADAGSTAPPRSTTDAFALTDWALFAAVSAIWGSSYLLIKIALAAFHPGLITWGRVGLGAIALQLLGSGSSSVAPDDRRRFVVLSVVWVGIPFTLFPLAEQHINSAVTGLLTGAAPLFAVVFGALWFGRTPRAAQLAGLVAGLGGIVLISYGSSGQGDTAITGVIMTLVATVSYGLAANLAGPLQERYGSVATMRRMLALAAVWTAPFGVVGLFGSSYAVGPGLAVAVLGVVGTGLAFVLMAGLVGRVGGPRASFVAYVIPAVALVLGVTLQAETVATPALLGVPLVLTGAALASQRESRPETQPTDR